MSDAPGPIVVDLGRASRKKIRQLEAGGGPLVDEVADALAQVREQMGDDPRAQHLVPVVLVYSRKRSKDKGLLDVLF
ncbi:MAG TPA: hypothetical protein VHE35_02380 [Kofleriaceae bacterium]|nr:hypothetical protein [Kofleriaceae bacterium]